MPNVLIRNLDESTHRELARRAEERGQSLQQFLNSELTKLASTPTMEEVLRKVERRRGGRVGIEQAVADLSDERPRP